VPEISLDKVIDAARQKGVDVKQNPPDPTVIFEKGDDIIPVKPYGSRKVSSRHRDRLKDVFDLDI
jgi:hypothetical protein